MMMTLFATLLWWNGGRYQPRHRSPRRDDADADWLDQRAWEFPLPAPVSRTAWTGSSTDTSWLGSNFEESDFLNLEESDFLGSAGSDFPDFAEPDFLDQLTRGQMRRILEACAINDLTETTPELVQVIANSSHTSDSLLGAWSDFREATRDAYALHYGKRGWWEFFAEQDLGSCPEVRAVEIKLSVADDAWCLIQNGRT